MLVSKIITYGLNAYLDAQICEELVTYIRTNGKSYATPGSVAQQRAAELIAAGPVNFSDPSFIIGLGYTEYFANGLADVLYTDLLWPFVLSADKAKQRQLYHVSMKLFRQQLTTSYQYEELTKQRSLRVTYWPIIVADPWHWVRSFANKRCNFKGPLVKSELRRACLLVQKLNSHNNHTIADLLIHGTASDEPKVVMLRHIASQVTQSEAFLKEAATTQYAAARWDSLFMRILRL